MNYKEISSFVDAHRIQAITFLQSYLQIPSPTGSESAVSAYLESYLCKKKFDVEIVEKYPGRPNLLMNWYGGEGKTLLFNGHLDVFPPTGNAHRNPWSGEIKGDKIYARGATDMKAGNAAGILAISYLKEMGFVPNGTIKIGLNCDEEQGGEAGILYCIEKGLLKADFTICMEASENTVIVDTDGRIAWKISFKSNSWHAGTRLPQFDALYLAYKAIECILEYDKKLLNERYFKDGSGAVISVTAISAGNNGETVNVHPKNAVIWVDRRYTTGESIESAEQEIRNVLNSVALLRGSFEIETLFAGPRLVIDPQDRDIQGCINAYETVFHKSIHPGRRCGAGDAGKLAVAYGQKVPQFGPGVYSVLGTDDEYVSLDQYIGFIKVYMLFISNYFSTVSVS